MFPGSAGAMFAKRLNCCSLDKALFNLISTLLQPSRKI